MSTAKVALASLLYRIDQAGSLRRSEIPKHYQRLVDYGINRGYLIATPIPRNDWLIERSRRNTRGLD